MSKLTKTQFFTSFRQFNLISQAKLSCQYGMNRIMRRAVGCLLLLAQMATVVVPGIQTAQAAPGEIVYDTSPSQNNMAAIELL